MFHRIIIAAAVVGSFGAGIIAATPSAPAHAGTGRVVFVANDGSGRRIIVRNGAAYLSAEDVATLRLVNYDSTTRAVYRVVIP